MKINRRQAWIIVFLFCVVVWGLVFAAISYASEGDKGIAKSQPAQDSRLIDSKKIKKLDLNDKQRKFIESLIEKPGDKKEGS